MLRPEVSVVVRVGRKAQAYPRATGGPVAEPVALFMCLPQDFAPLRMIAFMCTALQIARVCLVKFSTRSPHHAVQVAARRTLMIFQAGRQLLNRAPTPCLAVCFYMPRVGVRGCSSMLGIVGTL